MVSAWQLSLLNINHIEEFSFTYNKEHKILISGKKVRGVWRVSIFVSAIPFFAWGCRNHNTRMCGDYREVIRYYLGVVFNQLVESQGTGADTLLHTIKELVYENS